MNLKNDHNVYLLGAGFSREAGLPLVSDFLVCMRDSHEWLTSLGRNLEAQAVQSVLEFRLRAAAAAYYVTLDLENIEELFSLASATEGEMDRSIRIAIAATIEFARATHPWNQSKMFANYASGTGRLFPTKTGDGAHPTYPRWANPAAKMETINAGRIGPFQISPYAFHVARLLGLFLDGQPQGENTFITFNYDTVIEDALRELGVVVDYGFDAAQTHSSAARIDRQSRVAVLKLHGSVHWGRSAGAARMKRPLRIYESLQDMLANKAEPVLVPPTWKKVLGGPLEAIWDAAVQKLATATRIVIIGFSIPPTDLHFKYLLAAGLRDNISLRRILFVNPDERKELKPRAENLLRKAYIDSKIIDFAELGLSAFTAFHHRPIDAIGRPPENGLACDLSSI
jgi:hypothetical protein